MYMSKKKFDEIKAKHSTTIVVDADVGEALAFVQDLLEAEADAIKNREPHATASIGRLNEAAYWKTISILMSVRPAMTTRSSAQRWIVLTMS